MIADTKMVFTAESMSHDMINHPTMDDNCVESRLKTMKLSFVAVMERLIENGNGLIDNSPRKNGQRDFLGPG